VSTDYSQLLTTFPLFAGYTSTGTEWFVTHGRIRQCAAREVLLTEGDAATTVVLVLTGAVEQFVARANGEIPIGSTGPGQVLGDVQFVGGLAHPASARATAGTAVLEWTGPAFQRLTSGDAQFAERVMTQTAHALAVQAESLIASLAALKEAIR